MTQKSYSDRATALYTMTLLRLERIIHPTDIPGLTSITAVYFLFLLAVQILFSAFTLNRGFDISDEGYLVILAKYPDTFKAFVSGAQWITSFLWTITGSLYGFRATGLVIILLGATILSLGAIRAATFCHIPVMPGRSSRLAIISCTVGLALHWDSYGSTVFFTPSYNLLATAGSYSAIGLGLLACDTKLKYEAVALHLLAGASLGIVFLGKFPAGIIVSLLTVFLTIVFSGTVTERCRGAGLICVGMVATIVLIIVSHMPLSTALTEFRLGLSFYKVALQEPESVRLMRNGAELLHHWISSAREFLFPLLLFVLYALFQREEFAFAGVVLLVLFLSFGKYAVGGELHLGTEIAAFSVMLAALILLTIRSWTKNLKATILIAGLIALPYCVAIGTSNSFPPQILVSLGSWGTVIALFAYRTDVAGYHRFPVVLMCILFVSVSAVQLITSGLSASYHMSRPLLDETENTRIEALGTIRLDPEIHTFIEDLTVAASTCRISPGSPFIGLYNIPGVALVIQAIPVQTPWLISADQAEAWLRAAPPETLLAAVVGVQLPPDGHMPRIPEALSNFPDNYKLCGQATYPYMQQQIQIWAPKKREVK